MCIIVTKPQGVTISDEILENCILNNPDGFGYMYPDPTMDAVHIRKFLLPTGLKDSYNSIIRERLGEEKTPVVLHFRVRTRGKISVENCHPFRIHRQLAVAHNGTIGGLNIPTGMTDSETFAQEYLKHITANQITQQSTLRLIERAVDSSRLAFMNHRGDISIINKNKGTIQDGLWFSNDTFKVNPTTARSHRQWDGCNVHSHESNEGPGPRRVSSVRWQDNKIKITEKGDFDTPPLKLVWGQLHSCVVCGTTGVLPEKEPDPTDLIVCKECDSYIRCPVCTLGITGVDAALEKCSNCWTDLRVQ